MEIKRIISKTWKTFYNRSFVSYTIGGVIKTVLSLILLWLLEDKFPMPWAPTWTRIAVFAFIFLITYYLYIWLGYAKRNSNWSNFFKYSFSELLKMGLNLFLMYLIIDLIQVPWNNTLLRGIIICGTFIFIFFFNRWIGYAKKTGDEL